MRVKKDYMVITFHTTTEAMAMESECMKRGLPGRMIPVPREISAGCGLAWRVPMEEYQIHEQDLDGLGIRFQEKRALKL